MLSSWLDERNANLHIALFLVTCCSFVLVYIRLIDLFSGLIDKSAYHGIPFVLVIFEKEPLFIDSDFFFCDI